MSNSNDGDVQERASLKALLPASPLQTRIALIESMYDSQAAFNLAARIHLTGNWHGEHIVQSLEALIDRHEILRTNIVRSKKAIYQAVSPPEQGYPAIEIQSLEDLSSHQFQGRLEAVCDEMATMPFHLATDWLFRATLLKQADDHYHLVFAIHHSVGDAVTFRTFLNNFFEIYRDDPSRSADNAIEFGDYLDWKQRDENPEREMREQILWKEMLSNAPPLVDMPLDHPRPKQQSFKGARLETKISDILAVDVHKLAQDMQVTSAAVYLAAFVAILQSRSDQSDLVIGVPSIDLDGQAMGIVGPLLGMLPVRLKLSQGCFFSELVMQTSESLRTCQSHSNLSFDQIVNHVSPSRMAGSLPLFNIVFAHEQLAPMSTGMDEMDAQIIELDNGSAQYELSLFVTTTGKQTQLAWQYCSDLFDHQTVERIGEALAVFLEAVTITPDARLKDLPITGADERSQIASITENAKLTDRKSIKNAGLAVFSDDAINANRIALSDDARSLTFETLNTEVASAAAGLAKLCGDDESAVAIILPLSIEAIVAILAAISIGKCFIPLDSELPTERVKAILKDADCHRAISNPDLAFEDVEMITLDALKIIGSKSDKPFATSFDPEHPVYLAYTSGSTGKPKAVETTRSNLEAFLTALDHLIPTDEDTIWLALTPISFDMSVIETIWPLTRGLSVKVAPTKALFAGKQSFQTLVNAGVSHMITTPAVLKTLLQSRDFKSAAPQLRYVMLGGERFDAETAKILQSVFDGEIVNAYGPTEATVFCISHSLTGAELGWIPVGKPVHGSVARICDSFGRQAAMGVRGELLVGGPQVCKGYLNMPEQTDRSFFQEGGTSWYRTGDVAAFHPQGIRIHERIDRQVKIAGNRVELGEIETVLAEYPDVDAVVCIADKSGGTSSLIQAFVISKVPKEDDLRDILKRHCRSHLAPAAVPTNIILVDEFPMTVSGKLDETELLAKVKVDMNGPAHGSCTDFSDPVEQAVYDVWVSTLGHREFGIDDNFFEIGGSSMELLNLLDMLNEKFPDQFDIASMVEGGTVSAMSVQISGQKPIQTRATYEF